MVDVMVALTFRGNPIFEVSLTFVDPPTFEGVASNEVVAAFHPTQ